MRGEWKIFLKIPSELILYVDVGRCAEETKNARQPWQLVQQDQSNGINVPMYSTFARR